MIRLGPGPSSSFFTSRRPPQLEGPGNGFVVLDLPRRSPMYGMLTRCSQGLSAGNGVSHLLVTLRCTHSPPSESNTRQRVDRGSDTPQDAGLLHLLYCSVCMIFWRVFMRIHHACAAHVKFGLLLLRRTFAVYCYVAMYRAVLYDTFHNHLRKTYFSIYCNTNGHVRLTRNTFTTLLEWN
ncbi:hypothetical protein EV424DRAFT_750329 [Suillus variegatus]|nr:hypothetical protein EV424DRAFT_750329 [Suillus variegatus]